MSDDELSDVLNEAYRRLPAVAEPSPFLWRRTRAALRQQGLLREHRRGRLLAAGVMAAGLAGFAIGWGTGRTATQAGRPVNPAVSAAAALADPLLAAQLVQETGTAHVIALEVLARSLQQRGEAADVALGQQVTLAAARAQARALSRLLPRGLDPEAATTPASAQPIIWF